MTKAKILVVEDEAIVALSIQSRLRKQGYQVPLTVRSGEEALAKIDEIGPDLVLMDIQLHGRLDGVETACQVQAAFDVPVVYLTAFADQEVVERALHAGSYGYLLKPFQDRELFIMIETALYKHRMERRLKESERWLATTLKSIGDAIIATDSYGRVKFMNPVAEKLTGWSQAEALGQELGQVFCIIGESTGRPLEWTLAQLEQEGLNTSWLEQPLLKTRNGADVPIELSPASIQDETRPIAGLVLAFRDITERRQLEEQLRQSLKMEAVGQLAGGVAHDFNNILTVIIGYAELLLQHGDIINDGARRDIEQIKKAGERAASLTQQLLAFSRKQVLRPRVLDLNGIVTGVEAMLLRLIGEDIQLVTRLQPGLGSIKADAGQIEQVIVNLVVNARDAMAEGGAISLETKNILIDSAFAGQHPGMTPGPYVMLAVTDTGHGMDTRTLSRIFEPFFTTKETGKGTGLGLAAVHGITKQSQGHIQVESKPGQGATFSIYFPQVNNVSWTSVVEARFLDQQAESNPVMS